jgi:Tfp pilus assembly protein PilF
VTASADRALALCREGTSRLLRGELDQAIELFTLSLRESPTAEAYTFRGWAYSFQGRLDDAIEECRKAIATDPGFGNPYNDIGCYLVEQGRGEEAIPWFERAKTAPRYEPRHFPYLNLGRLRASRGEIAEALAEFQGALAENPDDPIARHFIDALRLMVIGPLAVAERPSSGHPEERRAAQRRAPRPRRGIPSGVVTLRVRCE